MEIENIKDGLLQIKNECENILSIPYYAYAENEAANHFAQTLLHIHEIVSKLEQEF